MRELRNPYGATRARKDRRSSRTGVERVSRDFGKKTETPLARLDVATARALLAEGQFPPGSMGPKIDAAIRFVEAGGREVLITRAESLPAALEGETGTVIWRTE